MRYKKFVDFSVQRSRELRMVCRRNTPAAFITEHSSPSTSHESWISSPCNCTSNEKASKSFIVRLEAHSSLYEDETALTAYDDGTALMSEILLHSSGCERQFTL
jgi:hypothetical protein